MGAPPGIVNSIVTVSGSVIFSQALLIKTAGGLMKMKKKNKNCSCKLPSILHVSKKKSRRCTEFLLLLQYNEAMLSVPDLPSYSVAARFPVARLWEYNSMSAARQTSTAWARSSSSGSKGCPPWVPPSLRCCPVEDQLGRRSPVVLSQLQFVLQILPCQNAWVNTNLGMGLGVRKRSGMTGGRFVWRKMG